MTYNSIAKRRHLGADPHGEAGVFNVDTRIKFSFGGKERSADVEVGVWA